MGLDFLVMHTWCMGITSFEYRVKGEEKSDPKKVYSKMDGKIKVRESEKK